MPKKKKGFYPPKPEIYVSVDIETDGPIPGQNSMLSLGAVAFSPIGTEFPAFEINFKQLDDAVADPDTMDWWETQKEAWEYARKDPRPPKEAIKKFSDWVNELPGKPVFVGYPAGFDFLFVYWYLMKFLGKSPFSFSAVDIKTYAMCLTGKPYRQSTKRNWPKSWMVGTPKHTHKAVDDARGQGIMFMRMLMDRGDRDLITPPTEQDSNMRIELADLRRKVVSLERENKWRIRELKNYRKALGDKIGEHLPIDPEDAIV